MHKSFRVAVAAAIVAAAATACDAEPLQSNKQWFGAAVMSPHTKAPAALGGSVGPYTVKCSGTEGSLVADVAAPDGWQGTFRSKTNEWTLRESEDADPVTVSGKPDSVSYLKYEAFTVDSEAFAEAPGSWYFSEGTVHVNLYIDCRPPP